jgi:hypothetical protein
LFIGAESAALAKHGVDERRFAVINVRDNGDVTDTRTQMVLFLVQPRKVFIVPHTTLL